LWINPKGAGFSAPFFALYRRCAVMNRYRQPRIFLGLLITAFGMLASGGSTVRAAPIPVIIDTDIGDDIDDAFAVALALQDPRLQVIGITAAWGDTTTRVLLIRRLLAAMGRTDVIVAQGPATANKTPFTQARWAMGAKDQSPAPDAVEYIRTQASERPGEITLIALAPLTNLEALIKADPVAYSKLRAVALMGGSIAAGYNNGGGSIPNPKPSAEYNIAMAPQALRAVLAARVPVTMFPLDSTQIKLDEVRRDRMFAHGSPTTDAMALLYHQWRLLNAWGQLTPTLFDSAPVAWVADPKICSTIMGHVTVDNRGFTNVDDGKPNAALCLEMAPEKILTPTIDLLAPEPKAPLP
jgi:inosine-uridine nucleoside N-ribohydrolase